jgi:hypothetical protein
MKKGIIKTIENKNRKFGSINQYQIVNLQKDGLSDTYLFTNNELEDAKERALNNAEDILDIEYIDTTSIQLVITAFLFFLLGIFIGILI